MRIPDCHLLPLPGPGYTSSPGCTVTYWRLRRHLKPGNRARLVAAAPDRARVREFGRGKGGEAPPNRRRNAIRARLALPGGLIRSILGILGSGPAYRGGGLDRLTEALRALIWSVGFMAGSRAARALSRIIPTLARWYVLGALARLRL